MFAHFVHDSAEKGLVTFTTKKDPTALQIIARWMADEVCGAVARVFEMIIHPFDVGGHPADASFQKSKLEVFIAVEQAGAKHAGEPCHNRQDARKHTVRKMVLKEFVDDRELQAKMYGDRHL